MDARRIVEMAGSFVLGGGLVALGYELVAPEGAFAVRDRGRVEVGKAEDEGDAGRPGPGGGTARRHAAPGDAGEPEGGGGAPAGDPSANPFVPEEDGTYGSVPPFYLPLEDFDAKAEKSYPRHGLVTAGGVVIREQPDLESRRLGVLRGGTRVRLDGERAFGGGCGQGWHQVWPAGWICLNAGIEVGSTPPDDGLVAIAQPDIEKGLPYDYWRVNHDGTPFFHRLPSYEEQDRADTAARAWLDKHGREPMPTHPKERPAEVPAAVKEYLNAGYYVTISGEHIKSKRRFLRTNRGTYARKYQLEKREGSDFEGQLVTEDNPLPMHFIVRELELMSRESPNSGILVKTGEVLERRSRHRFKRKVRVGDYEYWEDEEGRLLRAYAVGEAAKIKRPPGVAADERWVHVDLSEQVLVAYEGDRPVFTTLVSTGKEPGMTPVGVFRVQSKFVATSMRDQPVEEEAYSIEDVPWTQYFNNNVALHGAFWHGGFGLVRSHGCVNLSPTDARWLFGFLGPKVPAGWHAVFPGVGNNGPGSAVVVTE